MGQWREIAKETIAAFVWVMLVGSSAFAHFLATLADDDDDALLTILSFLSALFPFPVSYRANSVRLLACRCPIWPRHVLPRFLGEGLAGTKEGVLDLFFFLLFFSFFFLYDYL